MKRAGEAGIALRTGGCMDIINREVNYGLPIFSCNLLIIHVEDIKLHMKLTKNEKNKIYSNLKEFGEKSQALSSEFIKLLRFSISQHENMSIRREKIINSFYETAREIEERLNKLKPEDKELIEGLKSELQNLQLEIDELKNEQAETTNGVDIFNESLRSVKQYTNSFQSDFLQSISIINNAEIDNDEK
ncbi:TPA: hypothetical protein ACSTJ0_001219 [Serratia fonticola]